jgi:hypothetical protein
MPSSTATPSYGDSVVLTQDTTNIIYETSAHVMILAEEITIFGDLMELNGFASPLIELNLFQQ